MTLDKSAPLRDQVDALVGAGARRWTRDLPPELQEWLERLGPREHLPEWLLDLGPGGDFLPMADQIATFARAHLPARIRESTLGAMGDSIYVMAAARLLPDAESLRERLLPLLDQVWAALNDNDHVSVLLVLPQIAGLAGQGRQMLDGVDRPAAVGRRPGSGFDDQVFVDEYLRRRADGETPETLKADIAQRMLGGGAPESKAKRLERAVRARKVSLPSSPMKRRDG